jgi:hypothetical protein
MESWSVTEFILVGGLLKKPVPAKLCKKNSDDRKDFSEALEMLKIFKNPSNILRRDLFGMEARFEFGKKSTFLQRLSDLKTTLSGLSEKTQEFLTSNDPSKLIETHKIIHLYYNPITRNFSKNFLSNAMVLITNNYLECTKTNKYMEFLDVLKSGCEDMYRSAFENVIGRLICVGCKGVMRPLSVKDDQSNVNFSLKTHTPKSFTYVQHGRIYCFCEAFSGQLLGVVSYKPPLFLSANGLNCPTIDGIIVDWADDLNSSLVVTFVQCTVSEKHSFSPAALFSMIVFIKLLGLKNDKVVSSVRFFFIVPSDKFTDFGCAEATKTLRNFGITEIKVVKLDLAEGTRIDFQIFPKKDEEEEDEEEDKLKKEEEEEDEEEDKLKKEEEEEKKKKKKTIKKTTKKKKE